ncbi:MAG: cupin domain-containing protein [Bryobacteraceae bacterium]
MRNLLIFAALAAFAAEPRSTVFEWEKMAHKTTANGERRNIVDRATATMKRFESHVTTLDEGKASHAPHRHADEEVVIVKEGTLEVTIEGKPQLASTGSMVIFSSNELHGIRNGGKGRASYYVLRIETGTAPK